MAAVKGGEKLVQAFDSKTRSLSTAEHVDVGFLPDKTYPDGTLVALVAAVQEFGAPSKNIPPRPFFRGMVAKESKHWGKDIATLLGQNDYNSARTLDQMGLLIGEELTQAIVDFAGTPLKPATTKAKGFDKQLVDTGVMQRSVSHVVKGGADG